MSDNLERRIRNALDAEVEAILQSPAKGTIDPARLARLKREALTPGPPIVKVPPRADADADYRGMAAREGCETGLSDSLEKKIRSLEDQEDA